MSKYRLFNMSVLQAKPQPGQAEGNFYVAGTLENQDCVFEENTNIVMFGVDGLIAAIRPYLDAAHGGTAQTSNEDQIPERYRFLNGIFVRQKLEHGMSYLLDNNGSPRLDKSSNQPITMDSVLVFCILISETPKVDGTPNYAKNWDPVSIVVLTGLGASGLRMQRSWQDCHLRRHSGLHWWEASRREPCCP